MKPAWQMSKREYLLFVLPILFGATLALGLLAWLLLAMLSNLLAVPLLAAPVVRLAASAAAVILVLARYLPGLLRGWDDARRKARELGLLPVDDNPEQARRPA